MGNSYQLSRKSSLWCVLIAITLRSSSIHSQSAAAGLQRPSGHRLKRPPHFLQSSACCERETALPFSGTIYRCSDTQITAHPYHGGKSSCPRGLRASSQRSFSHPGPSWYSWPLGHQPPGSSTSWGAGQHNSAMGDLAHSSFIFPKTFLFVSIIWKASGWLAETSLSTEASRNWALSMNQSCPRKEMYFSMFFKMQVILPPPLT